MRTPSIDVHDVLDHALSIVRVIERAKGRPLTDGELRTIGRCARKIHRFEFAQRHGKKPLDPSVKT